MFKCHRRNKGEEILSRMNKYKEKRRTHTLTERKMGEGTEKE